MSTTLSTDPVTHSTQSDLDALEARLSAATSDEATLEADVAALEISAEAGAAESYLTGAPPPKTPALDVARAKLRGVRAARVQLMLARDRVEAEISQAGVTAALTRVGEIHADRNAVMCAASALLVIVARLHSYALADGRGGYEIHGRIVNNGMLNDSDLPTWRYGELQHLAYKLNAAGVTDAEDLVRSRAHTVPGGPALRNKPVVGEVRKLVCAVEEMLTNAKILPSDLSPFRPEVAWTLQG